MKIFIFIFINILIIAAAELTGKLFFNSGAIHAIALIFVIVAALPLVRNYYLADPIFKKFLNASIFAFLLFSVSHAAEYFLFLVNKDYVDFIFAIAINFYLASILLIVLGSEIFLRAYSGYHRSRMPIIVIGAFIALIVSFSFFLIMDPKAISLEPESIFPYIYMVIVIIAGFLFWKRISKLKTSLNPSFAGFFRFFGIMIIFVMASALFYIFYELIEKAAKIPEYQTIYFSHFFFYIGLSIMFFAFEELLKIGGVVKDVRELLNKKNNNNNINR
ncbi:MAG: hypothetical protein HYT20_02105 [Candidatus Nealsonbacteria bacterium]|nr:hypothetical protein [Candidatus Nealsonbacteria bacterium]